VFLRVLGVSAVILVAASPRYEICGFSRPPMIAQILPV
jgi:hypothetical protein